MMEWYTIKNVEALDTPALVLYPDRIRNNIGILKSFVDDTAKLRPHIKTSKNPEVVKLMREAGIMKFKCATIAEAEMLARQGSADILLAYQPVGPKATRFCELQKNFKDSTFSCLIDNQKSLSALSAVADQYAQTIEVLIDLNVGMNRTGIAPGTEALELYREARKAKGITFSGLHAYDGHIRDADLATRTQKCNEAYAGVEAVRQEIARDMGKDPLVVAGGTPTFPIHAKRQGVEASPGTFIYWDNGYAQVLAEQPFEFAAVVLTRVISRPDAETICLDLGHKAIASENPLAQRVYFLNAPGLQPIGHSEEHMVFRVERNHPYQVGDVFYGIPHHICPTVALHEENLVCTGNTVSESWPVTARKRKITV